MINEKVSVVGTITLHVRIGDSRVKVVYGAVRNLSIPVLLAIPFIDGFVKCIFPPEQKIVIYSSKGVPNPYNNDLPEEPKDKNKAQGSRCNDHGNSRPTLGVHGKENKDSTNVRKVCISCNRSERASVDRTSTSVGQYSSMDDILAQYRDVLEQVISCHSPQPSQCPTLPCKASASCHGAPSSLCHYTQ